MTDNLPAKQTVIAAADALTISYRSKKGGRVDAVGNISMELRAGETLAVVGESGSGKTTLMRGLLGLVAPNGGSVSLFGKKLALMTRGELAAARRRCGYVPQDPYGALPPGLSALEAVCEPDIIAGSRRAKAQTRERARGLLAELGLSGERILSSRAVSLSGGQRQRVGIARALMLEPELLMTDEPTSMQDVSTRGGIIEILKKQVQKGAAILFITHDLLLAAHIADRIMVIKDGCLCEEGNAGRVIEAPNHTYTAALLRAVPRINRNQTGGR